MHHYRCYFLIRRVSIRITRTHLSNSYLMLLEININDQHSNVGSCVGDGTVWKWLYTHTDSYFNFSNFTVDSKIVSHWSFGSIPCKSILQSWKLITNFHFLFILFKIINKSDNSSLADFYICKIDILTMLLKNEGNALCGKYC